MRRTLITGTLSPDYRLCSVETSSSDPAWRRLSHTSRVWKQRREGKILHNSWSVALACATRSSLGISCKSAEMCMKLHCAWAGCPTEAPGDRHACACGLYPRQLRSVIATCCVSPVPFAKSPRSQDSTTSLIVRLRGSPFLQKWMSVIACRGARVRL